MLTKYLFGIIAVLAFGGGTLFGSKLLTKKCPDCNPVLSCPQCPECPATVSLNTFDFDKIQNKKGNFHLNNHLSNVTIKIEAKDSTLIRELLKKVR